MQLKQSGYAFSIFLMHSILIEHGDVSYLSPDFVDLLPGVFTFFHSHSSQLVLFETRTLQSKQFIRMQNSYQVAVMICEARYCFIGFRSLWHLEFDFSASSLIELMLIAKQAFLDHHFALKLIAQFSVLPV